MKKNRLILIPVLIITTSLLIASCSGGGSTTTTTSDTRSESQSTEAEANSGDANAEMLLGSWKADAAEILNANTADSPLTCSGTITIKFDGAVQTGAGDISCFPSTDRNMRFAGDLTSRSDYVVTGDEITFSNSSVQGKLKVGDFESDAPSFISDGAATYAIIGDQLKLTFTEAEVGTVTHTYTRVQD